MRETLAKQASKMGEKARELRRVGEETAGNALEQAKTATKKAEAQVQVAGRRLRRTRKRQGGKRRKTHKRKHHKKSHKKRKARKSRKSRGKSRRRRR